MNLEEFYQKFPRTRLHNIAKELEKEQGLNHDNYHNGLKYLFKMDLYLNEKIECLNYINSIKPGYKTFLDIGSGTGFWELLCKHSGHSCVSTNEQEYPVFKLIMDTLGIDCKHFHVYIQNKTVIIDHNIDPGLKFDVITAQRTVFNYYPHDWKSTYWASFLKGCGSLLNPNGVVFIKTNYSSGDIAHPIPAGLRETFKYWEVPGMNAVTWCFPKEKIDEIE